MTLGSYAMGPNNMICREWTWKAWPWAQVGCLIVASMEILIWAGLAWLAKPSIGTGCRTFCPRTLSKDPYILPFLPFYRGRESPLSSGGLFLLYSCLFSYLESTCKFHFSGVQTCPVNPYPVWFGVIGKVKRYGLKHGFVRYRAWYYVVGSFSLTLLLNSVSPFLQAFREVPSKRSSSVMALLGLGPRPWAPM